MAISTDTNNYNIHAAMPDDPWKSGYTAAQMKAICDQAANLIQQFINDTLVPQINAQLATKDEVSGIVLGQIPDGTITSEKFAVNVFRTELVTLPASGWVGSSAPYTQTATVPGITASSTIGVCVNPSATGAERAAAASASMFATAQGTNQITVAADGPAKPAINIPIAVIVWR